MNALCPGEGEALSNLSSLPSHNDLQHKYITTIDTDVEEHYVMDESGSLVRLNNSSKSLDFYRHRSKGWMALSHQMIEYLPISDTYMRDLYHDNTLVRLVGSKQVTVVKDSKRYDVSHADFVRYKYNFDKVIDISEWEASYLPHSRG